MRTVSSADLLSVVPRLSYAPNLSLDSNAKKLAAVNFLIELVMIAKIIIVCTL